MIHNIFRTTKPLFTLAVLLLCSTTFVVAQEVSPSLISGDDYIVPTEYTAMGIKGEVKLVVDVNKDGSVSRAGVYVGPGWPCGVNIDSKINMLMRQIEKWVSDYKFSPATKNGKPVTGRIGLSIKLPETDPNKANILDKSGKLVVGGVVNGKAISLPKPAYLAAARAERASGPVSVRVLIDEKGTIIWSQAVSGHPLLMFASRDAACGAKFSPTLLAGEPVKVSGVVTYNFVP